MQSKLMKSHDLGHKLVISWTLQRKKEMNGSATGGEISG